MTEAEIRHNIARVMGINRLNSIQAAMADNSEPLTVLLAPTGSGKTLAFTMPLLRNLGPSCASVQAVVIAPSRELVLQIQDVIRPLATGYKTVAFYGGHSMQDEVNSLVMTPDIVISTPGRLVDHIKRGNLRPGYRLHTLVLDEYDKSLELGFAEEMRRIMRFFVAPEHIILTSATRLEELPDYFPRTRPREIDFLHSDSHSGRRPDVVLVESPVPDKLETLGALLRSLGKKNRSTKAIVFVNHRESAERVHDFLRSKGFPSVLYHGALEQHEREKAVVMLNNSSAPILVATDLAARGLDIDSVDAVIHYHPATSEQAWIHRNGRTARQDADGTVYAITGPGDDRPEWLHEDRTYCPDPLAPDFPEPEVASIYLNQGRKEKISRGDIVGFLLAQTGLQPDQIGPIALKDHWSVIAVPAPLAAATLEQSAHQKIKNRKAKFTRLGSR